MPRNKKTGAWTSVAPGEQDLEFIPGMLRKSDGGLWAYLRPALQARGWHGERLEVASPAGWPDVIAMRHGKAVFMEMKVLKPSRQGWKIIYRPGQKSLLEKMQRRGFPSFVVVKYGQYIFLLPPLYCFSIDFFVPENVLENVLSRI